MEVFSLLMVFLGAVLMAFNINKYVLTIKYMKNQTYDERLFKSWIYNASLSMMIFFLIGYIIFAVFMITGEFVEFYILIALIFFFGAIFVACMVKVQNIMTSTITQKTSELIQSMVVSMEAKDLYTKGHSEHVRRLAELIYNNLPFEMRKEINLRKLKDAAILHDIGKIGIPDNILNKNGALDEAEMEIIKQHPINGKILLENTSYRDISDWVLYHHERVDGKGYYGIPNEEIPVEAKIISLADTFSALYTDRVYRKRNPFNKAISIIKDLSGTQLDPLLVEIFCKIDEEEINKLNI